MWDWGCSTCLHQRSCTMAQHPRSKDPLKPKPTPPPMLTGWQWALHFRATILLPYPGIQIAPEGKSCSCTLGPRVRTIYILKAPGFQKSTSPEAGKCRIRARVNSTSGFINSWNLNRSGWKTKGFTQKFGGLSQEHAKGKSPKRAKTTS